MKDAGVVVRRYVGADRIGLGSEIDGDLKIHLSLDAFDAPGEFGPWQSASRATVQGLGQPRTTPVGCEECLEDVAAWQVAPLSNERLVWGNGKVASSLWSEQLVE
ncbi:hypothetical protein D3C76_1028260 [compost metagenome]